MKTEAFDFESEANRIIMKTETDDEQKFDPSKYQFFPEEEDDDEEEDECDCPDCLEKEVQIIDVDDDDDVQFLPQVKPQERQQQQSQLDMPPEQQQQQYNPERKNNGPVIRQQVFRCTYDNCGYTGNGNPPLILHIRRRHFGVPETLRMQRETGQHEPEAPEKYIVVEVVDVPIQRLTDFEADQLEAAFLSVLSVEMDNSARSRFYENLAFTLKLNLSRVTNWFHNRRRKQKLMTANSTAPVNSRCKRGRKVRRNRGLAQSEPTGAQEERAEPQPCCSTWNEDDQPSTSGSNAHTQQNKDTQLPSPLPSINSGSSSSGGTFAQTPPQQPPPTNSSSNFAAGPSTRAPDQPPPKPKCIRAQALEARRMVITSHCSDSLRIKQEVASQELETMQSSNPPQKQLQPLLGPSSNGCSNVTLAKEALRPGKSMNEQIQTELNKHSQNSVCLSAERQHLNHDNLPSFNRPRHSTGIAATLNASNGGSSRCLVTVARRGVGGSGNGNNSNQPLKIVCMNEHARNAVSSAAAVSTNSATNRPSSFSASSHATTPQSVEVEPISPPIAVRPSPQARVNPPPSKIAIVMPQQPPLRPTLNRAAFPIVSVNRNIGRSKEKSDLSTVQSMEEKSIGGQHSVKSRLFSNFNPITSAIALTGTNSVAARKPPSLTKPVSATNSSTTPQLFRPSSLGSLSSSLPLNEPKGRGIQSFTRNGDDDEVNRRNNENVTKQKRRQEHSARQQTDFYATLFSDPSSNVDQNKNKSRGNGGNGTATDRGKRDLSSSASKSVHPRLQRPFQHR